MKRALITILACLLILSLLAGCTAGPSSSTGSNVSTLQKVIQSKKLVAGCILSFPPFGYKDEAGKPQGYDVELAKALGESLKAEVEIVDLTSDARIPSLETGKVDVVIGNFTRNLERAQKIDFTDPYIVAGERLLVKAGSSIKQVGDLKGQKVAVTKGSTNADLIKKLCPEAEVSYFNNSSDALLAVKNGQCATFLEDSNYQQYQAKLDPTLTVVGDSLQALEYNSFGLKKGDQQWLNYLNLFVFNINTNGTNKELYKKFFGSELPFKLNPEY